MSAADNLAIHPTMFSDSGWPFQIRAQQIVRALRHHKQEANYGHHGPQAVDGAQRGNRIGYPISLLGMPPTLLRIRTHPAVPASCKGDDDVSSIQPLIVRRSAYEGVLCSVEQEQDDFRSAAPHL